MTIPLRTAIDNYLPAKSLSRGTRNEYASTVMKREQWGGGVPIEDLRRKDVREFLDWVHERAVADESTNPAARRTRPASTARRPVVGLGAGTDRRPAAVPQAPRAARLAAGLTGPAAA